jgi:uncharacterized membrane-anchored protein
MIHLGVNSGFLRAQTRERDPPWRAPVFNNKDTTMQTEVAEETFDPSEFEEPELYESMKILKSLENIEKNLQKKNNLCDLKKTMKRQKLKEKEKVKSKLKRPHLDLEKMMKVNQIYLHLKNNTMIIQFFIKAYFQVQKLLNGGQSTKT